MSLKCKKDRRGLTVGKFYKEIVPYPNPFNATIEDDFGEPLIIPRKEFFDELIEE